jgi:hypothetical protein
MGTGRLGTSTASAYAIEGKAVASPLAPTGTGFTYQGRLMENGSPASGEYDFIFTLYDAQTDGVQIGQESSLFNQPVSGGLFTVIVDFGAQAFDGNARWIEIAIRAPEQDLYQTLTPRQPVTPAPYALFALKTKGYQNVVTVAKSGGDFTSIQDAIDSISGNSYDNRYLVWVAPGEYDEHIRTKMWVDIEGSGPRLTTITSAGSETNETATINASNQVEIRSLSIKNTGGSVYSIGVKQCDCSGGSLRDVDITATGSTNNYGVYNNDDAMKMTDVTVYVSGDDNSANYGVYTRLARATLERVKVTVSGQSGSENYGVYQWHHDLDLLDVRVNVYAIEPGANSYGVFCETCALEMDGTTVYTGGSTHNYAVYLNNTGATIRESAIFATGYNFARYGVYLTGSSGFYITTIDNSQINAGTNTIHNVSGNAVRISATKLEGGAAFNQFIGMNGCAGVTDENYAFFTNTCP